MLLSPPYRFTGFDEVGSAFSSGGLGTVEDGLSLGGGGGGGVGVGTDAACGGFLSDCCLHLARLFLNHTFNETEVV